MTVACGRYLIVMLTIFDCGNVPSCKPASYGSSGCGLKQKEGKTLTADPCIIDKLLAKNLSSWEGLPAVCELSTISKQLPLAEPVSQGLLGAAKLVAHYRVAQVEAYNEPLSVWYREGRVIKIQIQYPAFPNPRALVEQLGQPQAKLDYYYAGVPKLNREGEWVYANRGLTLFMSSDRNNIVELAVYAPMTVDRYQQELHVQEPPKER